MNWPEADFCPCGWRPGLGVAHEHGKRLRKFWQNRIAREPNKFGFANPKRSQ